MVRVVARVEPVVVQRAVEPVVEPLRHAGVQQEHDHQAMPVHQRQRLPPRQHQAQQGQPQAVEQDEVIPADTPNIGSLINVFLQCVRLLGCPDMISATHQSSQ